MRILTVPEFINRKTHDALAIFGSGYSINWISKEQWDAIDNNFDTIGFNWYCKSKRATTFYLVREQCASPKRIEPNHTLDDFIELMQNFKNSTKIIKDMEHQLTNYQHARNLKKFDGEGFVFNDLIGGCSAKSFLMDDIFFNGIHHGKCTIYDTLHFAIGMGYKKVLFCGIDLYDNRYFYLKNNETLKQTEGDGLSIEAQHLTANKTIKIINDAKNIYPEIQFLVQNPRSLLSQVIPVWSKPF